MDIGHSPVNLELVNIKFNFNVSTIFKVGSDIYTSNILEMVVSWTMSTILNMRILHFYKIINLSWR